MERLQLVAFLHFMNCKEREKPLTLLSLLARAGVLEEAEFYNIASLVRLVKERIRDNENRTSQVCENEARMKWAL